MFIKDQSINQANSGTTTTSGTIFRFHLTEMSATRHVHWALNIQKMHMQPGIGVSESKTPR